MVIRILILLLIPVFGRPERVVETDVAVSSRGDLHFFLDTSVFRGPEGYGRLETTLLIDARQLRFGSQRGESIGEIALSAAVMNEAGERVADRTWVRSVSVEGLDDVGVMGAPFRDVVRFDLQPGSYRVLLHVRDVHGEIDGRCRTAVQIPDFEQPGLVFSDIQFASRLERSGGDGRFVKQGWKVMPNTTRYYLSGSPLAIYFELYNFSNPPDRAGESFILGYSLLDSTGTAVKQYRARRYLKPGESVAKGEILETEGIEPGLYQVQVEAFDGHSREYVNVRRRVYLFSKQIPQSLNQVQKDLLHYYMNIRYVADEKTLKAYGELVDWPARMAFLNTFWKQLDPTPGEQVNERLVEHLVRMGQADRRFYPGHRRRGSDTDRGRVYVQHGPPDDIRYHTFAAGQKPYEVWVYERQGRYEFVFRDRRGDGVYEMVHSTYPGELQNPYWEREF